MNVTSINVNGNHKLIRTTKDAKHHQTMTTTNNNPAPTVDTKRTKETVITTLITRKITTNETTTQINQEISPLLD